MIRRTDSRSGRDDGRTSLATIVAEWGRIGCLGFGGPPAHINMLRELCVTRRRWMDEQEFTDAIAACNLLPGPASTQLAIYCAWRLRRGAGAALGGLAFILPGLVLILLLSALFLANSPPTWIRGAAAGAGAAVAAVALQAGLGLLPASWARRRSTARACTYLALGGIAAATVGPWLVLVLLGCGVIELIAQRGSSSGATRTSMPLVMAGAVGSSALLGVAWLAVKVGALSYGGGFVIVPLMQADAVNRYHWMSGAQFLDAVALGQITPGPVVHTVAVVGYAAAGVTGGLLAAAVAFAPSFMFVLAGGRRFDTLRRDRSARAFLDGTGPASVGAILGSAVPLARSLVHPWQFGVLAAAAIALLVLRRPVVLTLLAAAATGVIVALAGGAVST